MNAIEHIGTKMVSLTPMTRAAYNTFRGWELPKDENGDDEGFLVEYLDGASPPNVEGYDGYISWSPKKAAEAYQSLEHGMSFGHAMLLVQKGGYMLSRKGWNGKEMFIFKVDGSKFEVNRPPLNAIFPEGTQIEYGSHIDIRAANGEVRPWLASQADMAAEDWIVYGQF